MSKLTVKFYVMKRCKLIKLFFTENSKINSDSGKTTYAFHYAVNVEYFTQQQTSEAMVN